MAKRPSYRKGKPNVPERPDADNWGWQNTVAVVAALMASVVALFVGYLSLKALDAAHAENTRAQIEGMIRQIDGRQSCQTGALVWGPPQPPGPQGPSPKAGDSDIWNTPIKAAFLEAERTIAVTSAGPDSTFGTADDIKVTRLCPKAR